MSGADTGNPDGRRRDLLEQLNSYNASSDEQHAHRALLDLVAHSPDPLTRIQYDPGHITAGAIVMMDDRLLLIHHGKLDKWLAPGGHIDPEDATMQAAAARELFEETGVSGRLVDSSIFDVDVHPIPASAGEPPHHHFNLGYRFTADDLALVASDEVKAVRWVLLDEVAGLGVDAAITRIVGKLNAR